MADSYPVIMKRGLAGRLDMLGLGIYKGPDDGAYTATERGIFTDGPNVPLLNEFLSLTTLTPFDEGRFNRVTPVQIRSRVIGGRTTAENLSELIRDAFHDKYRVTLGTGAEALTFRRTAQVSSLFITADEQGRSGYFQTIHFHGRKVT